MKLTYAQMEGYAVKAGWSPAQAPVVAAIGEAESGGNTDAVNKNDNNGRQSSYGWLQISNGTHSPPSPNWADPATNAALGYAKYKAAGNSFRDWGTYDSGAYRAYLSGSTTPDLNVPGNAGAIPAELTAAQQADCLIGFSGVPGSSWVNDLFGSGGNAGSFCLLSRSQARGILGASLLVGGVVGGGFMLGLMIYLGGARTAVGVAAAGMLRGRANASLGQQEAATAASERQARQAAQASQRQQAAQARQATAAARQPAGRHARTGPNAPASGRHAAGP